jgi:hypothetical protein
MQRQGHREDNWKSSTFLDPAKDFVPALEALGLLKPEQ